MKVGIFSHRPIYNKGSFINHVDRILCFCFPPPFWTILLNWAYVVKWIFGYPLPLPYPHGL